MSANDVYAEIVELYDLEHADFAEDVELLLELADLGDGPILELGCGTGRVLLPLAEAGHSVVGIDSSEPMLSVARQRIIDSHEQISAHVIQGDMTELARVEGGPCGPCGPYGLVIASLNSLMHLTTPEAQRMAIQGSWELLASGGRLVIDTLNPSLSQLNHLLNTTHLEGSWVRADGSTVDKWGHRRPGNAPQTMDTLLWYDSVQADGTVQRVRTRFELRYVYQSELALMLEVAGFSYVDWYGNYELDPWDAESERIIAVAHKD
ncbi:MAG: class I SAM-dependent methyltransferase [Thermomicrobiales bacterium]|nr:class I SAM-dependent methyltransferase [Thermomicrobiales bacterium]